MIRTITPEEHRSHTMSYLQ